MKRIVDRRAQGGEEGGGGEVYSVDEGREGEAGGLVILGER